MGRAFAGTPLITLVAPSKAASINYFRKNMDIDARLPGRPGEEPCG